MKKVNKQSKNNYADLIQKLKEIYPPLFKDEGNLDEEELKSLMKNFASTSEGKYEFNWAGKMNAKRNAFTTSRAMLKPDKERSLDFDNTENLIMEGDNLEVLKLLQKSYQDKIKCIYIDPPYNTGNDFIYSDDFSEDKQAYWEKTGVTKDGVKLDTNTESNGRYHSDWLNMMYPRLLLVRNLLTDDGVIFVSIDDNEVHNLRKIMDEIFGEENFIAQIVREAIKGGSQSKNIRTTHDYVLAYGKLKAEIEFTGLEQDGMILNLQDKKGPYAKGRELNKWGVGSRREDSPSMWFPIKGPKGEDVYPIRNDGSEGRWRLGKVRMEKLVKDDDVIFEKRNNGSYIVYEKIRDASPKIKQFTTLFKNNYINAKGTEILKKCFGTERAVFDFSKPVELVIDLLRMSAVSDYDITLDFFAGSGTTAQAVMELNKEDGGNRKYILVQIPEKTDKKSEAYKEGYKTISDICIERAKRVSKKLEKEEKEKLIKEKDNLDLGFKVFTLSKSYFPENLFVSDPDKTEEENRKELERYLKDVSKQLDFNFDEFDLMYEVLLKDGFNLNFKLEKLPEFTKNNIYKVTDSEKEAYITLDSELKEDTLEKLQKFTDSRFLCLERALNTTKKWNLQNMFGSNLLVI
jgi:adenine-specific DNA-methyltransferase